MDSNYLLARDLLSGVYNRFRNVKNSNEVAFTKPVRAVIDKSSNGQVYSLYPFAILVDGWAISFGFGSKSSYHSYDIAAVKVEETVKERVLLEIEIKLKENEFFRQTIIGATAEGYLFSSTAGVFQNRAYDSLMPIIHNYARLEGINMEYRDSFTEVLWGVVYKVLQDGE